MSRRRLEWTPEMDATLLRLRGRLHPFVVADRIGVSAHTMYRRLRELGQPIRRCVRQRHPLKRDTASTRMLAASTTGNQGDHEHA